MSQLTWLMALATLTLSSHSRNQVVAIVFPCSRVQGEVRCLVYIYRYTHIHTVSTNIVNPFFWSARNGIESNFGPRNHSTSHTKIIATLHPCNVKPSSLPKKLILMLLYTSSWVQALHNALFTLTVQSFKNSTKLHCILSQNYSNLQTTTDYRRPHQYQ